MKIKYKYSDAEKLIFLISFVMFSLFLTNISLGLQQLIGIPQPVVTLGLKILIGMMFLFCIPNFVRRMSLHILKIIFVLCIIFCLQLLLFPELDAVFADVAIYFSMNCLSVALAALMLEKEEYGLLLEKLIKCSYIIAFTVIVLMLSQIFGLQLNFSIETYSMSLGYVCLLLYLLMMEQTIQTRSMYSCISVIALCLFILSYGSRGPLIGIVIYLAYCAFIRLVSKKQYLIFLQSL